VLSYNSVLLCHATLWCMLLLCCSTVMQHVDVQVVLHAVANYMLLHCDALVCVVLYFAGCAMLWCARAVLVCAVVQVC
jgi:hypothetical protein